MDRSLRKLTGSALMPRTPPGAGECSALASNSDLVVVSHGTEAPHPLFNFGTQGALDLWEVDWPTFVAMESRASAEEDERAERERLLALVREQGYVDGYTGVRASSTGLPRPRGSFGTSKVGTGDWPGRHVAGGRRSSLSKR